jgi:hypothetical protein
MKFSAAEGIRISASGQEQPAASFNLNRKLVNPRKLAIAAVEMFSIERLIARITVRIFMTGVRLFQSSIALSLLLWCTSCAEIPTTPTTAAAPPTPVPGYWNGDGVPGSPKIIVSISEQRAYFYKGKNLVGESTVSTGKPGFGTPPGSYTVFWKDADHVSSVFGDYVDEFGNVVKSNIDMRKDSKPPGSHYDGARMPFAMFFRGGYAMHQGYVPPYAASHGCIRLPQGMAEVFFNAAEPGTPVIVKQEAVMHVVRVPPQVPAPTAVAPPAPTLVRSTAPASVRPGLVRTTLSAPAAVSPPAPNLVRSPAPPPVRPGPRRSTVPAPSPIPLRSPAPILTTAPGPVRPGLVTTTVPAPPPGPVRYPAPVVSRAPARSPVSAPSPGPVRSTVSVAPPGPVRSPAPVLSRTPATIRPLGPAPLRPPSSAPVSSPAPASVRPTPPPVHSRTRGHVRSRTKSRFPAASPSPSPAR